jgi:hypothetical protein
MFTFCFDCIQEYISAPSWISVLIRFFTGIVVFAAFLVARHNLIGVRRAQSLQALMNLINLENDVRKNYSNFMLSTHKYEQESIVQNSTLIEQYKIERETTTELYFSSIEKLATLITSDFVTKQLNEKNWKEDYFDIFKRVKRLHNTEKQTNIGYTIKIENLEKLLLSWEAEIRRYSIKEKLKICYLLFTNKPLDIK